MRSFAIVTRRAYFQAKKRRKYAKNVVVNRSAAGVQPAMFFLFFLFFTSTQQSFSYAGRVFLG